MLDDAGFPNAKITASNALDAHIVKALLEDGAPLDNFGIGERLITSSSSPVLSGVYKCLNLRTTVNGNLRSRLVTVVKRLLCQAISKFTVSIRK